jgi:hypothetical protein
MRGTGWTEEERVLEAIQMLLLYMQERNSMAPFSGKDLDLALATIGLFLSPHRQIWAAQLVFQQRTKGAERSSSDGWD